MNLPKCPRVELQSQCIQYLGPVSEIFLRKHTPSVQRKLDVLLFYSVQSNTLVYLVRQKEREGYEVIVEEGKLVFKKSGMLLNTNEDSKWIFVLSTYRSLYVGQKKKGKFQHSSFLSGGVTTSAGRLVARDGILEV